MQQLLSVSLRLYIHYIYGDSGWCCCLSPLYGGCPHLRASVVRDVAVELYVGYTYILTVAMLERWRCSLCMEVHVTMCRSTISTVPFAVDSVTLTWFLSNTFRLLLEFQTTGLQSGNEVSVFSDVRGKCLKGSTMFDGEVLHVGNGVAKMSRQDLFGPNSSTRSVNARYI